jgi:hypothetical protein
LFSGAPFDSDGQSISGNGYYAKTELKATNESHVRSTDYFSDGERPLFAGSINDGDRRSDSTSESFSPPSQREQTDGVNTFESEEANKEETPMVFIDPASSNSLKVLKSASRNRRNLR